MFQVFPGTIIHLFKCTNKKFIFFCILSCWQIIYCPSNHIKFKVDTWRYYRLDVLAQITRRYCQTDLANLSKLGAYKICLKKNRVFPNSRSTFIRNRIADYAHGWSYHRYLHRGRTYVVHCKRTIMKIITRHRT